MVSGVKRRRHGNYDDSAISRRQATVYFTLPNGKVDILQECKTTFLNVFGITKRRIETIVKAKKSGELTFTEKGDNKKIHRKFSKYDQNLTMLICYPKKRVTTLELIATKST